MIFLEEQKFITINYTKQTFLRYDNGNKTGNRIAIFFSDSAAEIMEQSEEYHIDGTFKYAPNLFYQLSISR